MQAASNVLRNLTAIIHHSLPLRVAFWSLVTCLSIAIILTIAYPIVGCDIYNISLPCSHYLPDTTNECSVDRTKYCCGGVGTQTCESFNNCQIKPTPFYVPKCAGLLISAWSFDGLTLLATIAFCITFHKVRNPDNDENYLRMDHGIEIVTHPEDDIRTLHNIQIQR
jgi:hypothetical protein